MVTKFIKTGIKGLDALLKGGLRQNSNVLVIGGPGTGKSILGLQFICEGAKLGEPGLFITFEENLDSIRDYSDSIGLELRNLEKKGLITLVQQNITDKKIMSIAAPLNIIKQQNIKRVVLDSITLFEYMHVAGTMDFRKEVLDFLLKMKDVGVTLLATSQKHITNFDNLDFDPEDFIFEGLMVLSKTRKSSSFERCISIIKLRGQDHMLDIYPFTIKKGGVEIFPEELPFSLIESDVKKSKNG